jgi:hypothetical protein
MQLVRKCRSGERGEGGGGLLRTKGRVLGEESRGGRKRGRRAICRLLIQGPSIFPKMSNLAASETGWLPVWPVTGLLKLIDRQ